MNFITNSDVVVERQALTQSPMSGSDAGAGGLRPQRHMRTHSLPLIVRDKRVLTSTLDLEYHGFLRQDIE